MGGPQSFERRKPCRELRSRLKKCRIIVHRDALRRDANRQGKSLQIRDFRSSNSNRLATRRLALCSHFDSVPARIQKVEEEAPIISGLGFLVYPVSKFFAVTAAAITTAWFGSIKLPIIPPRSPWALQTVAPMNRTSSLGHPPADQAFGDAALRSSSVLRGQLHRNSFRFQSVALPMPIHTTGPPPHLL